MTGLESEEPLGLVMAYILLMIHVYSATTTPAMMQEDAAA